MIPYAIRIVAVRNIIHRETATVNMSADRIILICHTAAVTDKKPIQPGPIGVAVAQNVETLRELRNLSYAKLSRRLTKLGRPIAPLGLTRIRDLQRRVDVDDLIALALALQIPPIELLLPPGGAPSQKLAVTDAGPQYTHEQVRNWVMGLASIDAEPPQVRMGDIQVLIRRPGKPPVDLLATTDEEALRALAELEERPADGDD